MTSRNLGIFVKSVKINIRKNTVIGIPSADRRFVVCKTELSARGSAPFDHEGGMGLFAAVIQRHIFRIAMFDTRIDCGYSD